MEALSLLVLENNKEPKDGVKDKIIEFTNSLPYELTKSQKYAINQIVLDSKKTYVMNRLIQGDVGSGKTLVAMVAILINMLNGTNRNFSIPTF